VTRTGAYVFDLRLPAGNYIQLANQVGQLQTGQSMFVEYDIPDAIVDENFVLRFELVEAHIRRSYCQIATTFDGGQPTRPYRFSSGNRFDQSSHISAVFSQESGAIMRFDYPFSRLRIDRSNVQSINKSAHTVTVFHEVVADLRPPELTKAMLLSEEPLPVFAAGWHEAVKAMTDRLRCQSSGCEGHYYGEE
jgi:hypothetical protein